MMGLYPPVSSNNHISGHKNDSLPWIKLSEDYVGNTSLSLPSKYEPIAIYNSEKKRDALFSFGSWENMDNKIIARQADPSLWLEFNEFFKPIIYNKLSEFFKIPVDEIDYIRAYYLSDVLICMEYEGIISQDQFTAEEWRSILRLQMPLFLFSTSPLENRVIVSKVFNPILEFMDMRLGRPYNDGLLEAFQRTEKYIYMSTHDEMIINFLKFLNPSNVNVENVVYATNIIYELYKKQDGSGNYVKILYNNFQIHLPGCTKLDCDYNEFKSIFRDNGLSQEEIFLICGSTGLAVVSSIIATTLILLSIF